MQAANWGDSSRRWRRILQPNQLGFCIRLPIIYDLVENFRICSPLAHTCIFFAAEGGGGYALLRRTFLEKIFAPIYGANFGACSLSLTHIFFYCRRQWRLFFFRSKGAIFFVFNASVFLLLDCSAFLGFFGLFLPLFFGVFLLSFSWCLGSEICHPASPTQHRLNP